MDERIPAVLYLVRSRCKPNLAILCTEAHLSKWVNKILDKGEEPEVKSISRAQLKQMLKPDPSLN